MFYITGCARDPMTHYSDNKFMCILSNIMFNKNIYEIQFSTKLNIKALYAYRFCFYMYFSSMGLCGAVRVLRVCQIKQCTGLHVTISVRYTVRYGFPGKVDWI